MENTPILVQPVVTLVIGLVAGAIAVWSIFTQRALARYRLTLDLLLSQQKGGVGVATRLAMVQLGEAENIEDAIAKLTPHEMSQIVSLLDQYELIALGVKNRIVDYRIIRDFASSTMSNDWEVLLPLIRSVRKMLHAEDAYSELQRLARRLREDEGKALLILGGSL